MKPGAEPADVEFEFPAAFRRLCVETLPGYKAAAKCSDPAAFRRLCVETSVGARGTMQFMPSRLQAAVC